MSNPWVLGINTASETLGVALARGEDVLAEVFVHPAAGKGHHAERLMPAVSELCRSSGIKPIELGAIAVAVGPGGFTGLRTSLAACKAAAMALDTALIGVSTLDGLVEAATGSWALVMVDARKQDVFAALYQRVGSEWVVALAPELAAFDVWCERASRAATGEVVLVGDGAARLADRATTAWPRGAFRFEDHLLRAGAIARIGARRLLAGRVDSPLTLELEYLREPSATPNLAAIASKVESGHD